VSGHTGARWALLCAALGLMVLGLALGQNRDVLQKATHVCLECIGIG